MARADEGRLESFGFMLVRSVLPIALALVVAGVMLLAIGKDPIGFYIGVFENGILGGNWQFSLVLMTPLLLIAIGLIVAFRGQLWNLGYDGQFLLAGVFVAGLAPQLISSTSPDLAFLILTALAIAVGAAWTYIPAHLKARFGTNEIITTLVMSIIGIGLTNILIHYFFQDPEVRTPRTRSIPLESMLPYIPGTRVHVGFLVAIAVTLAFQFILKRTSFGLKLDVFGASPKSARHVGIKSGRMIIIVFAISGGLIGLAASMDMLGQWGYLRTNWNPAYGDEIVPFVFLARLSPIGAIPFVAFYSVFATGGMIASQEAGFSSQFLKVIVALILIFMAITEYIGTKRNLGQSYLPDELKETIRRPFAYMANRRARS